MMSFSESMSFTAPHHASLSPLHTLSTATRTTLTPRACSLATTYSFELIRGREVEREKEGGRVGEEEGLK